MIIRLLLLLIVLFLAYTVFQALRQMLTGPSDRRPRPTSRQGEDMVQDPQCGIFLPRTDALEATIQGESRYFCSEQCRTEYEQHH